MNFVTKKNISTNLSIPFNKSRYQLPTPQGVEFESFIPTAEQRGILPRTLKEYSECYVPNTEYGNFFIFNVKNGYLLNWQGNKEIVGYVDHFIRKDNFEID